MTRRYFRLTALVLALAATLAAPLYAQEQEGAKSSEEQKTEAQDEQTPKDADAQNDGDVQFDENLPPKEEGNDEEELDGAALNEALEKAVDEDLGAAVKENSAEDLLNLATETKLSASTLLDLTKVVSLCNKAEQRGLDEVNLEFCKQLRISAQLDRGLAVSQLFMDPELHVDQLPRGWEGLRDHAITDLQTALDEYQDMPVAQLAQG